MFTVELKINGTLIAHVYGHNEGFDEKTGDYKYRYEYYEVESRKVTNGIITHDRKKGLNALVSSILTHAEKEKVSG